MNFFLKLASVAAGLAPVLSGVAAIFFPGIGFLPKVISALPELIEIAEKLFGTGEGAMKKEYVLKGAQDIVDVMADVSTGGQKETWESVKPFVGAAVDGIVEAVNTFEPGTFEARKAGVL